MPTLGPNIPTKVDTKIVGALSNTNTQMLTDSINNYPPFNSSSSNNTQLASKPSKHLFPKKKKQRAPVTNVNTQYLNYTARLFNKEIIHYKKQSVQFHQAVCHCFALSFTNRVIARHIREVAYDEPLIWKGLSKDVIYKKICYQLSCITKEYFLPASTAIVLPNSSIHKENAKPNYPIESVSDLMLTEDTVSSTSQDLSSLAAVSFEDKVEDESHGKSSQAVTESSFQKNPDKIITEMEEKLHELKQRSSLACNVVDDIAVELEEKLAELKASIHYLTSVEGVRI